GKTPPCTEAIIKSGIKKVYIGTRDPNPVNNGKGIHILKKAGIKVIENICEKESLALNAPFFKYMTKNLPFITLKLAQSLDGKTATKTGDSKWISCDESRRLVHKLRSETDAIMVGAGTVVKDNPLLTNRLLSRQPVKIIIDSKLNIPVNAKIFSKYSPAKTIIAITKSAPKNKIKQFERKNAEIIIVKSKKGLVDLTALMKILAKKGIIDILAEGGSRLSASLLSEGFVDKVLFFIAPKIIADKLKIKQVLAVKNLTVKKIGIDYLFEGKI
ncbi:MAG: bifunctional diaminohydroxyphosphoribosylaminopyrimidine deaminase/5-amino-6-(5-phosphoribosylamino)uracil reductase RibD, partial [Candidatus Omnitrophica bacterium]|nr:bifunctional diaminohydroxyphosphoribosylaminopyrimidine deaminase/5-amino-6-(5-phosphoribosylamino)uracil reductase RibD [Candidatus Omnitrophota bacterium]